MTEQHLSDFDFELPPELIAQYPLADRSSSRLLHITEDVIEDKTPPLKRADIRWGFRHKGIARVPAIRPFQGRGYPCAAWVVG